MAPFLFGSPIIRKLLMSLELQILKLVKAIFLTTILKTTLFIQSYGQFGAVNTEILMRNERDYFKISTTISPSIQDLIDTVINFHFVDTSNANYGVKIFQKQTYSNISFYNPPIIWKTLNSNYGLDVTNIAVSDNNVSISYNYGAPRRRVLYKDKPPPPAPPTPKPFFYLDIGLKARVKRLISTFTNSYRDSSQTKTYWTYNLPNYSLSKTQTFIEWQYQTNIQIFRDGTLYREYTLTNKLPALTHVKSTIIENSKTLLIEIIDSKY